MNAPPVLSLLDAALQYDGIGWCIIPVTQNSKRAAVEWTPYQAQRPTVAQLHAWFDPPCRFSGIAVVLGAVSGNLAAADFDVPGTYDAWAEIYFEYAHHMPTDRGARGNHVFFRLPGDSPITKSAIKTPYGDLLAHEHYVLLPPSRHPTGIRYSWAIDPENELITIEPDEIGLGPQTSDEIPTPVHGPRLTLGPKIVRGERDLVLFRFACSNVDRGITLEENVQFCTILNEGRFTPPLEPSVVRQKCVSASKYHAKHPVIKVDYHLTELGNAKRFIAQHGHKVRFVPAWKQWVIWDGTRWKPDDTHEIVRMMKATIEQIYESANPRQDMAPDQRKAVTKWSINSEADRHISAALHLAQSEQDIPVTLHALNADHRLLNCRNGTLELPTRPNESPHLREHRQADMITQMTGAAYNPEADYTGFTRFLDETFQADCDLINFVTRAIGYACTGLIREHGLFILYGTGRNGKSTLMETIAAVLGDYATRTPVETLVGRGADHSEAASPFLAALRGTRLVIASEPENGKRLRESQVKSLTGGDTICARGIFQSPITFLPTFKIFLIANHKPRITGTDRAIWERIHLIPFLNYVPPESQTGDLKERLLENPDGILNWMIEGCVNWSLSGLGSCGAVTGVTADYRNEMDIVQQFLDTKCLLESTTPCGSTELYKVFQSWLAENGEYKMTQTAFSLRLKEMGYVSIHTRSGYQWQEIGIVCDGL